MEILKRPWPWHVAGPLIGLMVLSLLLLGNKTLGVSSSLRHIYAACLPSRLQFFKYDWKKETWKLFFVGGILRGGIVAATLLYNPQPVQINPLLEGELQRFGISNFNGRVPRDLFNWSSLFKLRGFILLVGGGFLGGFWNALCRWVYIRAYHHGIIEPSMAFPGSHMLFHGRRIYCS